MGLLRHWNIAELKTRFELTSFFETGTGMGVSLEHALTFDFQKLYSVEYTDRIYEHVKEKFKDVGEKLELIHDTSENTLKKILPTIDPHENIFFWLDAHFPDSDGCEDYNEWGPKQQEEFRLPLKTELEIIKSIRPDSKDAILIDDVRIYEDGPFQGGSWKNRNIVGGNGMEFVSKIFGKTHSIIKDYRDEGYLFLEPK